ncbi:MAG: VWA domain-containing protein [Thermodesulfobacteriota bacterium]
MNGAMLKKRFLDLLPPPLPSDWEAEENLEQLTDLPDHIQDLILQQVQAIWPVSNSLCYSYLACAATALSCLSEEQISPWVAMFLDIYEKEGLKAAQAFMTDVENNYLCQLRGETGIRLDEVIPRLQPYAKGIVNKPITLEESSSLYTDTARIFLPAKLTLLPSAAENFLLYKLMITTQLALINNRTYEMVINIDSSLGQTLREKYKSDLDQLMIEDFWNIFPEPRLAEDLFTLAEGLRIGEQMAADFSGLWGDTAGLRRELAKQRQPLASLKGKSRVVEALSLYLLTGRIDQASGLTNQHLGRIITELSEPARTASDSAIKTAAIYVLLSNIKLPYKPVKPLPYLGRLQPAAAHQVRRQERAETKKKFIEALAAILANNQQPTAKSQSEDNDTGETPARLNSDDAAALLIAPGQKDQTEPPSTADQSESSQLLIIDGPEIEIPEPLKELAAEIKADLGLVPNEYISAAHGLAGKGELPKNIGADSDGKSLHGAITYDEWDHRRAGFRKDWCILNEKKIQPVKGTFVKNTLEKYRGQLIKLKKQFEMLRCTERLVKRQRDGDDIDLDAVIESISDIRAGRPGSEQLFVRLRRDDRDIAVMFLIDMSSSTEGWVGEALKEALILMGEALEVLGDRYAIAGFSGMRRSRSDFYQIKDFAENYNEEIKGRIAAIAPQEYTRMGPPVRHATKILQEVDAKVRLLIILADGKPEDYDDYKGEYAIEDTRHALIEAKAVGIHPFCITIDQQAHDYNAHMYGEVNYIFLDRVSDLPLRMPAIYRNLTT